MEDMKKMENSAVQGQAQTDTADSHTHNLSLIPFGQRVREALGVPGYAPEEKVLRVARLYAEEHALVLKLVERGLVLEGNRYGQGQTGTDTSGHAVAVNPYEEG